jgi:hypothetical protein
LRYVEFNNSHIGVGNIYAYADCNVVLNEGVESVAQKAFQNTDVQSVSLPSTLRSVSAYAFDGCDELRTIEMADGVNTIESYAFAKCSSLCSVKWSSTTQLIGEYAFANASVRQLDLPKGLQKIGAYAFQNANVYELIIPDSLQTIGNYAFAGTKTTSYYGKDVRGTLRNVVVGAGSQLKQIGDYAFYFNPDMDSLAFSNCIERIGSYAFRYCGKLKSAIIDSDSLKYIGTYAFADCDSLKSLCITSDSLLSLPTYLAYESDGLHRLSLKLPRLKSIPQFAFSYCRKLGEVTIPEFVEKIDSCAFYNSNIEKVNFNPNLKTIGGKAFYYVNSLKKIHLPTL